MINLFIANTDNAWFDFLSSEENLTEVNFWWPGETNFRALQPGEMLAFRLKSPRNKIGGFGIFSDHARLPIQMAWETFGRGNGVSSLEGLRSAIAQLRTNVAVLPSTDIGSTVLVEPVFFPSHLWFDLPDSWSPSIQRGKQYSTDNAEGLQLWEHLLETARLCGTTNAPGLTSHGQARFGNPTLITPRLGQGAFRIAVTEAYGRQCAITNGKVLPALDAAHIKPYGEGGLHLKSNGILLRKDIHSVFDAGYVTIKDDFKFAVSKKVKEVFNNGEEYLRLHGSTLRLPDRKADWPDVDLLRWHNKDRYLG
ncbi:putative restriction endonuclease [Bradyrhizobium lablabi]|uniref:Putative restriction endonuclease n=1 Tax=Bradyrhizobium lablabi TaxID=722472 RepID=A0A1M6YVT1_9BRAD|nr:HNH endonuclease [Bradyrhizobium lablabi]SHL22182.1 putative restriction endonuclease [Bradyrhizobium lablabi]